LVWLTLKRLKGTGIDRMTRKEIRREIYRKYPKTEKEKQGCREEMARMKFIRDQYAKRLNGQKSNIETKSDTTTEV
jgi:hypothetical protein